jgi:hypothetical protein
VRKRQRQREREKETRKRERKPNKKKEKRKREIERKKEGGRERGRKQNKKKERESVKPTKRRKALFESWRCWQMRGRPFLEGRHRNLRCRNFCSNKLLQSFVRTTFTPTVLMT